jgi:YD repeat-containing protein
MKTSRILLFSAGLVVLYSCKKDIGQPSDGPTIGGLLVRIQQGTDPNIANDTVYHITYNSLNRIKAIIDSIGQDTLTAFYDTAGRLAGITETFGSTALLSYDSAGRLTAIDYYLAGSREQYTFTYANGIVSRKYYNSDLGMGGSLIPQEYFDYTVSGGNITEIKEYNTSGTLLSDKTMSYGSEPNPFKDLGMFNFANILGTDDIINFETYFNQNISNGFAMTGGSNAVTTNTFNNQEKPLKIVINDQIKSWLLTWQFSYH